MQIGYYPGCSVKGTAIELDKSLNACAKVLGLEIKEMEDWCCCGASAGHAYSEELGIALPYRNISLAAKQGFKNLYTPCAACYNRLKTASKKTRESYKIKKRMDELVGVKLEADLKVGHLLEVFMDEKLQKNIKEKINTSLEGLKVASYYGCLLIRPPDYANLDDPEDPQIMDDLVKLLGADAIDWSHKIDCCGAGLALTKTNVVEELSGEILKSALVEGADCVIAACPLCHANLDMRQKVGLEKVGMKGKILPIIYFTQLIGLALGIGSKELGLDKHCVDTKGLVEKIKKINSSSSKVADERGISDV